jgi:hypothetical protein
VLVFHVSSHPDRSLKPRNGAELKFPRWLQFRLSVPLRLTLLFLSILTFIAALPLTAFTQANSEEPVMQSYEVLEAGALGIFKGYIEWFANPLLLWSWLASYFNRPRASGLAAIVALGLALVFLRRHELIWSTESHLTAQILKIGPGYWLWLTSTLIMIIANADELINGLNGKSPARQ